MNEYPMFKRKDFVSLIQYKLDDLKVKFNLQAYFSLNYFKAKISR